MHLPCLSDKATFLDITCNDQADNWQNTKCCNVRKTFAQF